MCVCVYPIGTKCTYYSRRRSDLTKLDLQIRRFPRPLFGVTGTPVYCYAKLLEIFGTPVTMCLKVAGTPVKTCRNFGGRNRIQSSPTSSSSPASNQSSKPCTVLQYPSTKAVIALLQHTATYCNTCNRIQCNLLRLLSTVFCSEHCI